ncbi:hypothetical protein LMG32289_03133 [Cupriavidus pampae]|uniref:Uncharacterized protein n=1 Tax=Cupriavidus pampae TaxID=659251 RepID=A0ABN7YMM9_9BURK|nr:hypothetical protein LMG32289_03133 [Cupriavidus pampae]
MPAAGWDKRNDDQLIRYLRFGIELAALINVTDEVCNDETVDPPKTWGKRAKTHFGAVRRAS